MWTSRTWSLSDADWSQVTGCTDVDAAVNRWYSQVLSTAKLSISRKRHCYRTTSKPWCSPHQHKIAKTKDRLFRCSRESQLTPESWWPTRTWETGMFLNYGLPNCETSEALDTGWVHSLTQNLQRIGGLLWSLLQGGLHINRFLRFLMTLVLFMSPRRIVPRSSMQPLLGNAVHLQLHIHQVSPLLLLLHLPSSQSLRSQPSRLFRGVPTRKASGLDDFPAQLLFECAAEIAAHLCYKFNLSLSLFWIISFPMENCLHSAGLQEQKWPLRPLVIPTDRPASNCF